jgi:hypothetical protein
MFPDQAKTILPIFPTFTIFPPLNTRFVRAVGGVLSKIYVSEFIFPVFHSTSEKVALTTSDDDVSHPTV